MSNHYNTLGINSNATSEEIESAYRKLAIKYHPDQNQGDKKAADKFKEVALAFEVLSDPQKRSSYDLSLKSSFTNHDPFKGFDPFSVFRPARDPMGRSKGKDYRATIQIELEEVLTGCEKQIKVPGEIVCPDCEDGVVSWKTCSECNGQGYKVVNNAPFVLRASCLTCRGEGKVRDKICKKCSGSGYLPSESKLVTIKVPPGVKDGMTIREAGKGGEDKDGRKGNLFVSVKVKPHDFFRRDRSRLHCRISISYPELVLGTELKLVGLDKKEIKVKIPPRTNPSKAIRLPGLGLPEFGGKVRGDLYVSLNLYMAKDLSKEEIDLIKRLKEINLKELEKQR
jgi:molecular chaperone DnaJ